MMCRYFLNTASKHFLLLATTRLSKHETKARFTFNKQPVRTTKQIAALHLPPESQRLITVIAI